MISTNRPIPDGARRCRWPGGAPARIAAAFLAGVVIAWSAPSHAGSVPDSFSELAEKVKPAVVNISTQREIAVQRMPDLPFAVPEGSPFEEFFRRFFGEPPEGQGPQGPHAQPGPGAPVPAPQPAPRQVTAQGSGFIIDPEGYVVTNNHVIHGASEVTVTLNSGEEYPAELVGIDEYTDIALLKVEADEPLPHVNWGDSDAAKVGDWVLAVGNPFGLGGTVTAGIISARGRDLNAGPYDDFLQIDASVNRGNSGGPTFNLDGGVVGINTAIASPSGGNVGIAFAIPSNLAKPVIAQLRETGSVERGWLGVQIQRVTPEIAKALGLEKPKGALVAEVMPGGPAEKAGLKEGDLIVAFDGETVGKMRDLPRIVGERDPGSTVNMAVRRGDDELTLRVTLSRRDSEKEMAGRQPQVEPSAPAQLGVESEALGAKLAALTPAVRARFNIPEQVTGVLVVAVDPEGPAADQGLQPGDVIEGVGQVKVASPEEVAAAIRTAKSAKRDAVLLHVNRKGERVFLGVPVA